MAFPLLPSLFFHYRNNQAVQRHLRHRNGDRRADISVVRDIGLDHPVPGRHLLDPESAGIVHMREKGRWHDHHHTLHVLVDGAVILDLASLGKDYLFDRAALGEADIELADLAEGKDVVVDLLFLVIDEGDFSALHQNNAVGREFTPLLADSPLCMGLASVCPVRALQIDDDVRQGLVALDLDMAGDGASRRLAECQNTQQDD